MGGGGVVFQILNFLKKNQVNFPSLIYKYGVLYTIPLDISDKVSFIET